MPDALSKGEREDALRLAKALKELIMSGMPDEQELSNLVVRDEEGRVRLMIGLFATVFFRDQLSRAVREAVADVGEDYFARTREHARWSPPSSDDDLCAWNSSEHSLSWLLKYPDRTSWGFEHHGGECESTACAFCIKGFGSDIDDTGGLGFLHVSFPLHWFGDRQGTFPDYVLKLCQRMRPLSGYAGIGILETHDMINDVYWPVVRALAQRYPGLEVEDRIGHTNHLHAGIKGVNWLTILGDRWIRALGGLDPLRAALDESFGVSPYPGGVVIQAGPEPQLGDVEADRWPQHYVKLAKVLKKIQVTYHYPFHRSHGPGIMNEQSTLAWLFRFDGR